jgi:predicted pyridoxine 5'-phosphate oxidase superfamily flavin-nucleotide-binding protein
MTTLPGWPGDESPFHPGEQLIQAREGMRDRVERAGRKVIRAAMPDQHRELFGRLPYLVIGGVDAARRPWATLLAGPPGFVTTPDDRTLAIAAAPVDGDPLAAALVPGAPIAVLGIELATRRRNRANGTVAARAAGGLTIAVAQSFGNCPQYIQARAPLAPPGEPAPARPEGARLSAAAIALVRGADTCFIASAGPAAGGGDPREGADVSHRGGRPGFLAVADDGDATVLTLPDYTGNYLFNTLGNLIRHPYAGLLLVDFERGDLLSLTTTTTIVWDGPEVAAVAGAHRLVRLRVERGVWLPGRAPSRWTAPAYAPQLDGR